MSKSAIVSERIASGMADRILHRGPDAGGAWADSDAGIALAHRRLAILDQSQAGMQPMQSQDRRYTLVFNGEIYNHLCLRREITAAGGSASWRGRSDTETILAAVQIWGLPATLRRLKGMFALGLWDKDAARLFLARDRMGEKPLYFGVAGESFLFGSELKALKAHPDWVGAIDRCVLALYLRHGYVPDPYCIYQGFRKLPPGHWVEVRGGMAGAANCYWDFHAISQSPRLQEAPNRLISELEHRLKSAIGLQMQTDVAFGAFLSGGIDSSLVAALMQAQSLKPIKTFTIGFDVKEFNEARAAKAIASHLGSDHTDLILTKKDGLNVIPKLAQIWDEPFADSSQIPTLFLCQMAREQIKVALTGDGADELFGGYRRYQNIHTLLNILELMPSPVQKKLSEGLRSGIPGVAKALFRLGVAKNTVAKARDRGLQMADIMLCADGATAYQGLISLFPDPKAFLLHAGEAELLLETRASWTKFSDRREAMMRLDASTYLPGDILTKIDRAAMSVGLETRTPFLDQEVVEYAWRLPLNAKIKDHQAKWILREILKNYVPLALFDRPKQGFSVPIESWLAGPLLDWVEAMLDPGKLLQQGYLNAEAVRDLLKQHRTGEGRWHHQIWIILMFQAWLENEHIPEKIPDEQ